MGNPEVRTLGARFRSVFVATLAGLLLAPAALALDVSGVRVDEKIRLANQDLVLNGSGIRYAAAGFVRGVRSFAVCAAKTLNQRRHCCVAGPQAHAPQSGA